MLPKVGARATAGSWDALYRAGEQALNPAITWSRTGPRDLTVAAHACQRLGLDPANLGYPTLTVVGSKGKGTTTLAASAALAAAGWRVGTVTSPSYVSRTERIRVAGTTLTRQQYVRAASYAEHAAHHALADLRTATTGTTPAGQTASTGPTATPSSTGSTAASRASQLSLPRLGGMHFLAALTHFAGARLDAAVLEASMGGLHDEVALLASPVVAVTEIFEEHIGVLGDNAYEIAHEKLGVVTDTTRVIVTLTQSDQVQRALAEVAASRNVRVVTITDGPHGHHGNPLVDRNIELGRVAATELAALVSVASPTGTSVGGGRGLSVPSSLTLPGRCSLLSASVMVDSAVTGPAVQAALEEYTRRVGRAPGAVYVSVPRSKDDTGALAALRAAHERDGVRVIGVRQEGVAVHLRPDPDVYAPFEVLDLADVTWPAADWLAVGTISFIAAILRAHHQDLTCAW